jgi:hypothetical protein
MGYALYVEARWLIGERELVEKKTVKRSRKPVRRRTPRVSKR